MNLKKSRDEIRAKLEAGEQVNSPVLDSYRKNRDTEDWRSSLLAETLCEYILFLEGKVQSLENQISSTQQKTPHGSEDFS